jgi:hypothetical protein
VLNGVIAFDLLRAALKARIFAVLGPFTHPGV